MGVRLGPLTVNFSIGHAHRGRRSVLTRLGILPSRELRTMYFRLSEQVVALTVRKVRIVLPRVRENWQSLVRLQALELAGMFPDLVTTVPWRLLVMNIHSSGVLVTHGRPLTLDTCPPSVGLPIWIVD